MKIYFIHTQMYFNGPIYGMFLAPDNIIGRKLWNSMMNEKSSRSMPINVWCVNRMMTMDVRNTIDMRILVVKNWTVRLIPERAAKPNKKSIFPSVKSAESKIRKPRKRRTQLIPMQTRPIFVWSENILFVRKGSYNSGQTLSKLVVLERLPGFPGLEK